MYMKLWWWLLSSVSGFHPQLIEGKRSTEANAQIRIWPNNIEFLLLFRKNTFQHIHIRLWIPPGTWYVFYLEVRHKIVCHQINGDRQRWASEKHMFDDASAMGFPTCPGYQESRGQELEHWASRASMDTCSSKGTNSCWGDLVMLCSILCTLSSISTPLHVSTRISSTQLHLPRRAKPMLPVGIKMPHDSSLYICGSYFFIWSLRNK